MKTITTTTAEQTRRFGRRLGASLKSGDLICLIGDLGAGKTTLVQGIAAGAGYKGRVSSPSFSLVREYQAPKLKLYHLDLYRVAENETGDIGLEEYFAGKASAAIVEWPGAARPYLGHERLDIILRHIPDGRRLELKPCGLRPRRLAKILLGGSKK